MLFFLEAGGSVAQQKKHGGGSVFDVLIDLLSRVTHTDASVCA